MTIIRQATLALALASVLAFMVDAADARSGRGGSIGSRGSRTFTPPASTTTAPKPAAPIERSMTQPGAKTASPGAAAAPSSAAAAPSRFGGFGGLLLGGLLGAGLFGLLSGSGLFGGLNGLASVLGLMLQAGLIVGAIYLLMGFLRSRNQPALARASAGAGPGQGVLQAGYGGLGGGSASVASTVLIGSADYDAFEKLLVDVQTAYAREDAIALAETTTPEMLSYFSRELADNKRQGVRNEIADVKLL